MDSQVEEIKAKVDIFSLVSEYVSLKKSGKNYKGLCPFHGEKTPSFMVNPERNIFKCFGCDKGGDIFTFIEEIEGVSFVDALKQLARRAGVQLQQIEISQEEKDKDIYIQINSKAAEFYNYLLTKHPVGKEALTYLKSRGVTDGTIKEFQLGFATRQRDVLTRFLIKKGFTIRYLMTGGVSLPDGRNYRDRFYQRILFPIRNLQGDVVGFSGRILGDGEPKYLNSPDSPIFNKSKLLFGMDIAKTEVKKAKEIILVEGNFDVLLSHQTGVKNVVAPLGTGLGEAQIALIKRFTDKVSLCFDSDRAGQAATQRGIELAENAGLQVGVVNLKEGKDPAELISTKPEEWKKAATQTTPVLDFYLDSFVDRYGSDNAEGKRKISGSYLPILGKIEDPLIRTHYLQKMAALLKVDEEILFKAINRFLPGTFTGSKSLPVTQEMSPKNQVERYLLALILQSKAFPKELVEVDFHDATYNSIKLVLDSLVKENKLRVEISEIWSKLSSTEQQVANDLLLLDIGSDVLMSDEMIQSETDRCIRRLKEVNLRLEMKKLALALKQAEAASDAVRLGELNREFRDLSLKLTTLKGN